MKGQNNINNENNNSIKVIFTKCNGVYINKNNYNKTINNIITYNNNSLNKYNSFKLTKNNKKKIYLDNGQNTDISNNYNISTTSNILNLNKETNNINNNQIKSRNFSIIRLKYKNNNQDNKNNLLINSIKYSQTNINNNDKKQFFLNEFNDLSNSNIKKNIINIQLDNKISFIEKEDLKKRKNKIYYLKKIINNIDNGCFNIMKKKYYKKRLLIKFLINNDIFEKKYFEEKKLNNLLNYIQTNNNFENIFNFNYKENLIKILLKKSLHNNNNNKLYNFSDNNSNENEKESDNFFKKRSKSNYILKTKNNKITIPKPLNNNTLFTNLEIKDKIQKNNNKFNLNKNNINNPSIIQKFNLKKIKLQEKNFNRIKNIIKINKFLKLNNNNIKY